MQNGAIFGADHIRVENVNTLVNSNFWLDERGGYGVLKKNTLSTNHEDSHLARYYLLFGEKSYRTLAAPAEILKIIILP